MAAVSIAIAFISLSGFFYGNLNSEVLDRVPIVSEEQVVPSANETPAIRMDAEQGLDKRILAPPKREVGLEKPLALSPEVVTKRHPSSVKSNSNTKDGVANFPDRNSPADIPLKRQLAISPSDEDEVRRNRSYKSRATRAVQIRLPGEKPSRNVKKPPSSVPVRSMPKENRVN